MRSTVWYLDTFMPVFRRTSFAESSLAFLGSEEQSLQFTKHGIRNYHRRCPKRGFRHPKTHLHELSPHAPYHVTRAFHLG